jgi:hypothetical protein
LEKFLDADPRAETNNGNPMERWEFWKLLGPEPKELVLWQNRWETDEAFDRRIPLIENTQTNALLLGLPSEEVLYQFLLSRREHFVNDDVCVFQPRPVIMVFGWMDHLWSLVQIARDSCEILHFSDLKACQQMMIENEDIDFLFIEHEFVDDDTLKTLTALARSRGLSWVLVSETAAEEVELRALNHGAEQSQNRQARQRSQTICFHGERRQSRWDDPNCQPKRISVSFGTGMATSPRSTGWVDFLVAD